MLALTDLNLCTHKPPTNLPCRRLQAKLSDWQNVLHARDVVRLPLIETIPTNHPGFTGIIPLNEL